MKVRDIKKNDALTLGQVKQIPQIIKDWLLVDKDYTLDMLINDQTIAYAYHCIPDSYDPAVIKTESLEWVANYGDRVNDYDSDLTVWVTAIVETKTNKIVRLGFDLFDSLIMCGKCSGLVHEPC